MENARLDKAENLSSLENEVQKPRRPRSMTTLKLQWVAERARKCRRIKEAIEQGTYAVDSREVAKALLNVREEDLEG
ncbi:MAG: flagellar biosynthesis anti-sigma factor FlgM [Bdellovibrionales bacterium]|nr:flagellar biosynthesis anti-sigma factor FlgM [Bdellovibrionales bacterium]